MYATVRTIALVSLFFLAVSPILLAGVLVEGRLPASLLDEAVSSSRLRPQSMAKPQLDVVQKGDTTDEQESTTGETSPGTPARSAHTVHLYDQSEGRLLELDLDEYLVGVVAAEMPASFSLEAIKAQAIASRTYTLYRLEKGETCSLRADADFCSDSKIGQGWLDDKGMRERWGALGYYRNLRRIQSAIEETSGMVITYENQPIPAFYHAASGGLTEAAEYVWGTSFPYLVSVDSPENSRFNEVEESFDARALSEKLDLPPSRIQTAFASKQPVVRVLNTSPTGRVLEAEVVGTKFTGTELREKLELRSTWFTVNQLANAVVISTSGYGHGVGLSQYGAAAMAEEGATASEIIQHYYPGTQLKLYTLPRAGNNRP